MSKIKITERFYSIQGEGRYVGVPSVFLRTYGCNFSCAGFNMPLGQKTDEPDRIIASIDLSSITSNDQLPLSTTGCDSYISWHPKLKHLSPMYEVSDLAKELIELTPNKSFDGIHLVITGGEPLLGWQKAYPELIELLPGLRNVTFETNGTQMLRQDFVEYLYDANVAIHFSVSAKLPESGESWEDAIKPDVVRQYTQYGVTDLKFVVDPDSKLSFDHVEMAIKELQPSLDGSIFLMSEGGTDETHSRKCTEVAMYALKKGYCYSPRLQTSLFGNAWNT